jgi:hypothetical protein
LAILQGILTPFIIIVIYALPQYDQTFLQAASYTQCAFNTLTDLYLAIAPSTMFWSLQFQPLQKIGLITLFSCSILFVSPTDPTLVTPTQQDVANTRYSAFAASVVKLRLVSNIGVDDKDFTCESTLLLSHSSPCNRG